MGYFGDAASGAATVILAMGDGKKASVAIHEYLLTGSGCPDDACDAEAAASNA